NDRRYVDRLRATLDQQDNQEQYDQDRKTDGDFVAALKDLGRGAIAAGKRLAEDPTMAVDLIAEGGGSLLVAGPVAKGVTRGASAIMGVRGAGAAGESAAVTSTIAGMEAGGAYAQVVQELMALDDT